MIDTLLLMQTMVNVVILKISATVPSTLFFIQDSEADYPNLRGLEPPRLPYHVRGHHMS